MIPENTPYSENPTTPTPDSLKDESETPISTLIVDLEKEERNYTEDELAAILKEMYDEGKTTSSCTANLLLFALKYGEYINNSNTICKKAEIPLTTPVSDGKRLYELIKAQTYGVAFYSPDMKFKLKERNQNYSFSESWQKIFYGAPGTGKSYKIKDFLKNHNVPKENIFRTTFHPDSDYASFVGAYKPTQDKRALYGLNGDKTIRLKQGEEYLSEKVITYSFIPQAFLNAYIRAYQTDEKVYLIIEEINRGNCAQIFGDLFQLLDRDDEGVSEYPIKADTDLKDFLVQKLGADSEGIKDGELCLPKNLYIYATMNTSDQSLFPIDSAFKRRWDWEYSPIHYCNTNWAIEIDGMKYQWVSFQRIINQRIFDETHSEDKMLGDYFVKAVDNVISENLFKNKVLFYLWNDVCKDGEGDIFKTSETEDLSFSELYGDGAKVKLRGMMDYLGVEVFHENNGDNEEEEEEDYDVEEVESSSNSYTSNKKDTSRYQLNNDNNRGRGYSKSGVVFKAIEYYCNQRPEITAQEVMNNWLSLGIKVPNLVETSETYNIRTSTSTDTKLAEKSKILRLNNNETLYISNQFNLERIKDFIERINAKDWGIFIKKID